MIWEDDVIVKVWKCTNITVTSIWQSELGRTWQLNLSPLKGPGSLKHIQEQLPLYCVLSGHKINLKRAVIKALSLHFLFPFYMQLHGSRTNYLATDVVSRVCNPPEQHFIHHKRN